MKRLLRLFYFADLIIIICVVVGLLLFTQRASAILFSSPPVTISSGGGGGGTDPTIGVLPSYNDNYANWSKAGLSYIPITASISTGGTMTVTTATATVLGIGQTVSVPASSYTGTITAGAGGTGSYTVSPAPASSIGSTTVIASGIPQWPDCTSAQAGTTMPLAATSSSSDVTNINTVITNCPNYTVIELAAGTFWVSSQAANTDIWMHKSQILRGAGTCNNSYVPPPGTQTALCQTVIQANPGGATQTYNTGGSNCGSCSGFAASPIYISPVNFLNGTGYDWTGCSWGSNCDNNASAYQLTSDGDQGSYSIQLNRVNGLTVGGWVRIDENAEIISTPGPNGSNINASADILQDSGAPPSGRTVEPDITNGVEYGALYPRYTSEIHRIAQIGGTCGTDCVTFDSPLTTDYRVSYVAQIYTPNNAFIAGVGIENLSIQGGVGGQTGGPLHMDFCQYCHLSNVEAFYWVGGTGIVASARVLIIGSFFHDCSDCENNGNEYPFTFDGGTTESLAANDIFMLGGKGMTGRACGGGNVVAYSYVDKTFYQASSIGNYWLDMGLNGSHYAGCHNTLFEGNWAENCDNDDTHGNDVFHTYFANWCTGLRSNFNDPSLGNPSSSTYNVADEANSDLSSLGFANGHSYPYTPNQRRAFGTMSTDYWMAFVNNLGGEPGVTCATGCTMTGWIYTNGTNNQSDKTIWVTGWVGGGSRDPYLVSTSGYTTCNGSTPGTCAYFFRHGNYDTVTASIADFQTGYSHTMPNSFYLNSAPEYFSQVATCTYTWPWVTPQGTNKTTTPGGGGSCSSYTGLPAKARYDAGTPMIQP